MFLKAVGDFITMKARAMLSYLRGQGRGVESAGDINALICPLICLREMDVQQFHKGQRVYREGDSAEVVFLIKKGEVEIIFQNSGRFISVERLRAGQFFGEQCLGERSQRESNVICSREAILTLIEKPELTRLLHNEPKFRAVFLASLIARQDAMRTALSRLRTNH